MGSGELVQTLIRHDLVEEYRLMIHPLVLGSGKQLFRDETPLTRFRLADTKVSGRSVLLLTYARPNEQAATATRSANYTLASAGMMRSATISSGLSE
jgi:dihydrofolate reductase